MDLGLGFKVSGLGFGVKGFGLRLVYGKGRAKHQSHETGMQGTVEKPLGIVGVL